MSSIENRDPVEPALATLVRAIAALGDEYRSRGVEFFPPGFETGRESFFKSRPPVKLSRSSFLRPVSGGPDAVGEYLAALWASEGRPELSDLAQRLAALSAMLRETDSDEPPEVSSFIYAMY